MFFVSLVLSRSCMNLPEEPDVDEGCLYSKICVGFEFVISIFVAHTQTYTIYVRNVNLENVKRSKYAPSSNVTQSYQRHSWWYIVFFILLAPSRAIWFRYLFASGKRKGMPLTFEEAGERLADQSACAYVRAQLKMCLLESDCCRKVRLFSCAEIHSKCKIIMNWLNSVILLIFRIN